MNGQIQNIFFFVHWNIISRGFENVDDFVSMANTVLNCRKSRAGKILEHHLAAVFDKNGILYTPQAVTEGTKVSVYFPAGEFAGADG